MSEKTILDNAVNKIDNSGKNIRMEYVAPMIEATIILQYRMVVRLIPAVSISIAASNNTLVRKIKSKYTLTDFIHSADLSVSNGLNLVYRKGFSKTVGTRCRFTIKKTHSELITEQYFYVEIDTVMVRRRQR